MIMNCLWLPLLSLYNVHSQIGYLQIPSPHAPSSRPSEQRISESQARRKWHLKTSIENSVGITPSQVQAQRKLHRNTRAQTIPSENERLSKSQARKKWPLTTYEYRNNASSEERLFLLRIPKHKKAKWPLNTIFC